ncbi:MAG: hypothetical protein K2V38_01715, partial [Gemmataceae bacterium]|nr:hypothetical protein [Gemmataceae bacterium]
MVIITGEKAYGKVDRVPGLCYVVTMFAHLNFIPLFPLRSYIVIEGSEEGDQFRGKQVAISVKSMAAGYARAWLGLVALIAGGVACFGLFEAAKRLQVNDLAAVGLVAFGLGTVLTIFVGGKAGGVIQFATHAVGGILWFVFNDAAGANRR